jgi:hypothetical protein
MSVAKQKNLISKVAQKIFEEATASSLGSTFHVIICFHLKQKFGKDPYEVFTESPKTFYDGLKEVLGEGAQAVIGLTGTYLTVKYDVNCTVEEFTGLFTKDDTSSIQRLRNILESIITQEEHKLKAR